ncbi:hypothetical protein [Kribbella italica]|uniref:Uncharacterized protein n=1 Tax=Kribbella italica TaxID=1540520 RepID=A0A7W9J5U3_9ACTN|nr:hypothetical protein [Kribbella italica]MBB5836182.1 hypothetical protein [Kribbella italica]
MALCRLLGGAVLALVGLVGSPLAAQAAGGPSNDGYAGVVAVGVPSVHTVDTTGATRGADDERAEQACSWMQPISAYRSVWYEYKPTSTEQGLRISTAGSDHDVEIAVFSGFDQSEFTPYPWVCGGSTRDLQVNDGNRSYTIVAFSRDPQAGGGKVRLSVTESPAADISVAVDGTGVLSADGTTVGLSGTVECNQGCMYRMQADVTQARATATGRTGGELAMETPGEWALQATVVKGVVRPGQVKVKLTVEGEGTTGVFRRTVTRWVRLTR